MAEWVFVITHVVMISVNVRGLFDSWSESVLYFYYFANVCLAGGDSKRTGLKDPIIKNNSSFKK
jgi:hypothetical protein